MKYKRMKIMVPLVSLVFVLAGCSDKHKDDISALEIHEEGVAASEVQEENNMVIRQFVRNPNYSSNDFSCSVYVLSSGKGVLLIDPGYYDSDIREYLESVGGLNAILLTHGHWDHIRGLDAVKQDYPEAGVYLNALDSALLTDPELNYSADRDIPIAVQTKAELISEGVYDIGGFQIELIHTPGHTKGSSLLYLKDEKVLFTGDTIKYDRIADTSRPTGSDADLAETIAKFKGLLFDDETQILTGHGSNTNYGELMKINKYLNE